MTTGQIWHPVGPGDDLTDCFEIAIQSSVVVRACGREKGAMLSLGRRAARETPRLSPAHGYLEERFSFSPPHHIVLPAFPWGARQLTLLLSANWGSPWYSARQLVSQIS